MSEKQQNAAAMSDRPSIPEKQPSPAAAPAQLSEVLADERRRWREAVRMDREAREGNERGMKTADWEALRAPLEKLMAEAAALAGQPAPTAPTEDREALRAATLERLKLAAGDAAFLLGPGGLTVIQGNRSCAAIAANITESLAALAGGREMPKPPGSKAPVFCCGHSEEAHPVYAQPAELRRPAIVIRLPQESNSHEDLELELVRDPGDSHRMLRCKACQADGPFAIALSDNGQWNLECVNCCETAAILTEVLAKLR